MSLEEFLAWEREEPERYEYAGGVITMMTGGSAAHVTIALNLAIALRSDMKVIANRTVRYPDISVTCRPVDDRDCDLKPGAAFCTQLPPGTSRFDRRDCGCRTKGRDVPSNF